MPSISQTKNLTLVNFFPQFSESKLTLSISKIFIHYSLQISFTSKASSILHRPLSETWKGHSLHRRKEETLPPKLTIVAPHSLSSLPLLTLSLSLSSLTLSLSPLTVVAPHAPLTRTHHSPHCCTTDRRCAALTIVAAPPSPPSSPPKSEKSVFHNHSPLTASPLTTPGRLCAHSSSPLIFIVASLRCAVTSRRLCAKLKAFFIRERRRTREFRGFIPLTQGIDFSGLGMRNLLDRLLLASTHLDKFGRVIRG
ncbi:uncharacterized protein LOC130966448 [Arachis stenosperma]|uniref:uncharacterized protein LOC130966448 n=1 Tax=Arachis stenosperma TaxID=217475 RepID=UPI0025AD8BEE|nr:uncharacterized protein LOC130966448 [Arachis stenosperma]